MMVSVNQILQLIGTFILSTLLYQQWRTLRGGHPEQHFHARFYELGFNLGKSILTSEDKPKFFWG